MYNVHHRLLMESIQKKFTDSSFPLDLQYLDGIELESIDSKRFELCLVIKMKS